MIEKHPCIVSVVFTSSVIVFHHQVTNAVYGEWLLQKGCFEDRHTEIEGAAKSSVIWVSPTQENKKTEAWGMRHENWGMKNVQ